MATTVDSSEIAAALTIDEIPVKLRCAACNKLAINAFRMPCCDQSICEDCQESLPQACPVCLHEPVIKDDCRPNKALRTTIKVFLKKKAVEREAARKKEMLALAALAPATPLIEEASAPQSSEAQADPATEPQLNQDDIKREPGSATRSSQAYATLGNLRPEASMDIPQQSIESPGPQDTPKHAPSQLAGEGALARDAIEGNEQPKAQGSTNIENGQWPQNNASGMTNTGLGFETNGGFPNMANMGMGDLNQMMQFMPNGMPNNMMGQFPNMMGMTGMGMDPMVMSQGMFGGFGGPVMGMNGVNGMNMGMGYDAGQNPYGGLNGQPQAFNQNQFGGHTNGMGGNFGAHTGYGGNNMPQHQGNFNQVHQHQNFHNDFHHGYHNQGFQTPGRARGRGGFFNAGRGRGYGPSAYQGRQAATNEIYQNQEPEQGARRGSPVYTPMEGSGSDHQLQGGNNQTSSKSNGPAIEHKDEEQMDRELEPGGAEDIPEIIKSPVSEENAMEDTVPVLDQRKLSGRKSEANTIPTQEDQPSQYHQDAPKVEVVEAGSMIDSNLTAPSAMPPPTTPIVPTGPAKSATGPPAVVTSPRGPGFGRGFGRGYSNYGPASRGRGFVPSFDNSSRPKSSPTIEQPIQKPPAPKGLGVEGAPTGPKALRQPPSSVNVRPPQDAGFSIVGRASAQPRVNDSHVTSSEPPGRSRSRSPISKDASSHGHERRTSASPPTDSEKDRKRDRHERSSRKDNDYYDDSREVKGSRTRDASTHSSTKYSSHRSHRGHDKDSSRSKHRSHRSHRERSKSTEKESRSHRKRSRTPELRISGASRRSAQDVHHRERDDDDGRSSRKRRQRDEEGRDYEHDHKRSRRADDSAVVDKENSHRSRHAREDGKDSRRASRAQDQSYDAEAQPPKGPKIDQHALEREARNRERQMKEIQRRALMEGKSSSGKSKTSGRAGERRASYKYEDEDLTSRVEKERESNRWG